MFFVQTSTQSIFEKFVNFPKKGHVFMQAQTLWHFKNFWKFEAVNENVFQKYCLDLCGEAVLNFKYDTYVPI